MLFSPVAGSARDWSLDFAKNFQHKKAAHWAAFLFQLFIVVMSVVVSFALYIHFFIEGGL
jgi:hypothetical protein